MAFKTVSIDSITIAPDRQRKDLGDLSDLKESIKRVGLINPPVITHEGILIAGERRLTAMQELGWSHIPVHYKEDLTEVERELIELDENIRRVELSWQERTLGILRIYELAKKQPDPPSTEAIAESLSLAPGSLRRQLYMGRELRAGTNPRIMDAASFSQADGILRRQRAREEAAEEENMGQVLGNGEVKSSPKAAIPQPSDPDEPAPAPIHNGDFIEWLDSYEGPRFNFLHCDFPYGIEFQEHKFGTGGARNTLGTYEDSEDTYWLLVSALERAMGSIVSESAHMIFWFSMKHYEKTKTTLRHMGWEVNDFPLIWHKTDNAGIIPKPDYTPRQTYETAFLCSRGQRALVGPKANSFGKDTERSTRIHMSQKPLSMLAHFFAMVVDETTYMLDPTCGSGTSLIAAHHCKAAHIQGIELNEEFYQNAVRNWKDSTSDLQFDI